MRFFSNEAQENTDATEYDENDPRRSQRATSDPVAVPHQRAGSPWSDAPGTADDDAPAPHSPTPDDSPATDDSLAPDDSYVAEHGPAADADRDPRDDLRTDEDEGRRESLHTDPDAAPAPAEDRVSGEGHYGDQSDADPDVDLPLDDQEPVSGATTTTYGPDGTVRESAGIAGNATEPHNAIEPGNATEPHNATEPGNATESDEGRNADEFGESGEGRTLRDEGGFDDPTAVEPATGEPIAAKTDPDDAEGDREPAATAVDGSVATDAETAAEPIAAAEPVAATEPVAAEPAAAVDAAATAEPVVATDGGSENGVVEQKPGSVPAPAAGKLFAEGDAFADRFRDIQLRFVDSPKEATADAATLVAEAVDQVTNALKAQKDGLASNSEDTEQLRVELRGYRDMLSRLSSL